MGKRLPKSSKNKKLKFVDPCYKGSTPQLKRRKLQTNEPPASENEQEMPRQLEEMIFLRNQVRQNKLKRRKKKKVRKDDFIIVKNQIIDKEEPGMKRKMKNVPAVVKQKRFENENQFFNRIQRMADMAIAEAKVEEKYNIELVNIDKKGNAKYVSAAKEPTDKNKEKWRQRREKQAEKKRLARDDKQFDLKREKIIFGEVASAPPVLTAKLRKAPELNKAGKRELILKNMLPSSSATLEKKVTPLSTKLPGQNKVLASERLRAVQMYRLLKSKKAS